MTARERVYNCFLIMIFTFKDVQGFKTTDFTTSLTNVRDNLKAFTALKDFYGC